MKTWIVNCPENRLEECLDSDLLHHGEEYDIAKDDVVYLREEHESRVVGPFYAYVSTRERENSDPPYVTGVRHETDELKQLALGDFDGDLSETRPSQNVIGALKNAFQFVAEDFDRESLEQCEADTDKNRDIVEKDKRNASSKSASLRDVVSSGRSINSRDFSGQSLARNQQVGDFSLRECDLSDTALEEVRFDGTDLRDVNFREANLEGAEFHRAKLDGTDFSKAVLRDATFVGDVRGTNFGQANLKEADLREATLDRADFSDAVLEQTNLSETKPKFTNFDRATMRDVNVGGATFVRASFDDTDLSGTDLLDATFERSTFRRADLSKSDFSETELSHIVFEDADLTEAKFTSMDASGTDFSKARLSGTHFEGTDLSGSTFVDARSNGAHFTRANLEQTMFSQADLFDADFTGAALYGCRLASARVGRETAFDETCVYENPKKPPRGVERGDEPSDDTKAASVYRTLELVKQDNSLTRDSLLYLFKRKEARRREARDSGRRLHWFGFISRHTIGHGTSFGRLLGSALMVIILYSLVYSVGGVVGDPEIGTLDVKTVTETPFTVGFHAVLFSLLSFTGLVFGDFNPTLWGKFLATTEAGFGVLFFALFIYIFTTKASR